MAHLYRGLADVKGCGAWIVRDGERTVGFLVGCDDLRHCSRHVLLRHQDPAGLVGMPRLFSLNVLRRVLVLLAYRSAADQLSRALRQVANSWRSPSTNPPAARALARR